MKHFVVFVTILLFFSCQSRKTHVQKITSQRVTIDNKQTTKQEIESLILPYRTKLNNVMDSVLCYAPKSFLKDDGELQSTAGNLMADIVYQQADKVFYKRHQKHIDFVLLNHGGIRSIISKGPVKTRNAYQIMPFENDISIVAMKGIVIKDIIAFLQKSKRAHPVSKQIQIELNHDYSLKAVQINKKHIADQQTYYVATSDYLVKGGDQMGFFANKNKEYRLQYKIRNAIIDYFTKVDTIYPIIDKRFIRIH
ncbi:MAG: 5'-nucleotidase C-terminal domain-containing protein [Flavobacteriaceae bacterium]|nr:5'-nucleotidase C-terminal domain-containing protein [Flavobacteriaceae bacterium]